MICEGATGFGSVVGRSEVGTRLSRETKRTFVHCLHCVSHCSLLDRMTHCFSWQLSKLWWDEVCAADEVCTATISGATLQLSVEWIMCQSATLSHSLLLAWSLFSRCLCQSASVVWLLLRPVGFGARREAREPYQPILNRSVAALCLLSSQRQRHRQLQTAVVAQSNTLDTIYNCNAKGEHGKVHSLRRRQYRAPVIPVMAPTV